MTLFKTCLAIATILVISCNSASKSAAEGASKDTEAAAMEAKKMMEAGFKKAVIVGSKAEGDCPYVLKMEDNNNMLDPINLEEGMKKDGLKVWVTYQGLRMMNRCVKANPVSIVEIEKRN
ncbi:MAG: hypothetical protein DWP94_06905 [Flavobacterium sp.]|nr:MAG: hypothetical protein DWP94_06905 [Flavobacterium sp.]